MKCVKFETLEFRVQYQQFNALDSATDAEVPSLNMFLGWKEAAYKDASLDLNNLVPLFFEEDLASAADATSQLDVPSVATDFLKMIGNGKSDDVSVVTFNMTFGNSKGDDGYDHYLAW